MPASPLRPTEAEALAEWQRLVDADAAQVERLREPEPATDYYAPIAARFRPGPAPSAELPVLQAFARPGDTWLDIGAGGGRFAVPLAAQVARLIAIEPSEAMRAILAAAASDAGRANIAVHDLRWPAEEWRTDVDVSLAAHSTYDIRDIGAFLDAMERHTRRICIAAFGQEARGAQLARLWEAVHGEPLQTLPALREFVALLGARGRRYDVRTVAGDPRPEPAPPEQAYTGARRFLWLAEGSEKERRMRALIDDWYGEPGGVRLPPTRRFIGIVSWDPPARPA